MSYALAVELTPHKADGTNRRREVVAAIDKDLKFQVKFIEERRAQIADIQIWLLESGYFCIPQYADQYKRLEAEDHVLGLHALMLAKQALGMYDNPQTAENWASYVL